MLFIALVTALATLGLFIFVLTRGLRAMKATMDNHALAIVAAKTSLSLSVIICGGLLPLSLMSQHFTWLGYLINCCEAVMGVFLALGVYSSSRFRRS